MYDASVLLVRIGHRDMGGAGGRVSCLPRAVLDVSLCSFSYVVLYLLVSLFSHVSLTFQQLQLLFYLILDAFV